MGFFAVMSTAEDGVGEVDADLYLVIDELSGCHKGVRQTDICVAERGFGIAVCDGGEACYKRCCGHGSGGGQGRERWKR